MLLLRDAAGLERMDSWLFQMIPYYVTCSSIPFLFQSSELLLSEPRLVIHLYQLCNMPRLCYVQFKIMRQRVKL
jgi:hypothetical protein